MLLFLESTKDRRYPILDIIYIYLSYRIWSYKELHTRCFINVNLLALITQDEIDAVIFRIN